MDPGGEKPNGHGYDSGGGAPPPTTHTPPPGYGAYPQAGAHSQGAMPPPQHQLRPPHHEDVGRSPRHSHHENGRSSSRQHTERPQSHSGRSSPMLPIGQHLSTGQAAAILHAREQHAHEHQLGAGTRYWENGLFGCFDNFKVCILSWSIPCYVIGQNAEYLGKDRMIYSLAGLLFPSFAHFFVRIAIREKLNIAGTELSDCCMVYWCGTCSLAQERREVLDAIQRRELLVPPQIMTRQ